MLQKAFAGFTRGRFIEREEMKAGLTKLGLVDVSATDLDAFFSNCDTNGDGAFRCVALRACARACV
jgi:hypothetical protein